MPTTPEQLTITVTSTKWSKLICEVLANALRGWGWQITITPTGLLGTWNRR